MCIYICGCMGKVVVVDKQNTKWLIRLNCNLSENRESETEHVDQKTKNKKTIQIVNVFIVSCDNNRNTKSHIIVSYSDIILLTNQNKKNFNNRETTIQIHISSKHIFSFLRCWFFFLFFTCVRLPRDSFRWLLFSALFLLLVLNKWSSDIKRIIHEAFFFFIFRMCWWYIQLFSGLYIIVSNVSWLDRWNWTDHSVCQFNFLVCSVLNSQLKRKH